MIKTIEIDDGNVHNLIEKIDEICRDFDSAKYGIPPEPIKNNVKNIVYNWVYSCGKTLTSTG